MSRSHLKSQTPEYRALLNAIRRCQPDYEKRANYFDRGIRVCEQWSDVERGISDFVAHVGPRPSKKHSLDRKDNNKGYEPGNVRWATAKEQAENSRKRSCLENFTNEELMLEVKRRGL